MRTPCGCNLDIQSQIDFIRTERTSLQKEISEYGEDSDLHKRLKEKIACYEAIEQNMYALKAIAIQLLKRG